MFRHSFAHWNQTLLSQEPELKMLRMQLIGADDPSVDGGTSMVHRWREYVDTYVMHYPTEWVPETKEQGQSSTVFLRRYT